MDMSVRCVSVLVIFLCALVIGRSEGRRKSRDSNFFFNDDSLEITQERWEQVEGDCRLDAMQMMETAEAFGFYLHEKMFSDPKAYTNTIDKVSLQNVINVLPLELKQGLLDCLQRESVPLPVSGKDDESNNVYVRFINSFFSWPDDSRRYLGEKLHHAPSPTSDLVVQSPTYAPEPSSGLEPASFYEIDPDPLTPLFSPDVYSDQKSYEKPSDLVPPSASPDFAPHLPPNKHHVQVPVAAAIGGTATGTFLFALVLVFFYRKREKEIQTVYVNEDDGPFLRSNVGSSPTSTLGGTIYKQNIAILSSDKTQIQSGKLSLSNRNFSMVSDSSSLTETSSVGDALAFPPLKPPPGRTNPPSGQPAPPPTSCGTKPNSPSPPTTPAAPPPPTPAAPPPPPIPARSPPGPPPPPKVVLPPRTPQPFSINRKTLPLRPNQQGNTRGDVKCGAKSETEATKSKLKPFFWDKVLANPDQSMVWHQISAGSFQFDEEMIENLFGYTAANKNKMEHKKGVSSQEPCHQFIQLIDIKKAQNISILLRALNVTTEQVGDALHKGTTLPTELLQTLLRMAPTSEEELKLRLYSGEISQLGHAERFLKFLVDIPFAFKRMDSLLFKNSLQEEITGAKESLATLEVACKEVRSSRLFLKLLEAVLKTGNRMNDGTFRGGAQAFKLDTLLKLSDVKGTDGKTTLLHFVVREIIRSEGKRAAHHNHSDQESQSLGLEAVSGLSGELDNVRRAAALDANEITSTVSKLGHGLLRTKNFLKSAEEEEENVSEFHRVFKSFVETAETEITRLLEEEKRIMGMVKSTVDYFHGSAAGKDEGLRLFVIVRDFLNMVDKACNEVRKSTKMAKPTDTTNKSLPSSPSQDLRQQLFPAIVGHRMNSSSSCHSDSDSDYQS